MSSLPGGRPPGSVVVFEVASGTEQPAESYLAFASEQEPARPPAPATPALRITRRPSKRQWPAILFVAAVVTCAMAVTVVAHWRGTNPAGEAGTGELEVLSQPPGAVVTVDGVARGVTPLRLPSLPAGTHTVVVASMDATVTHDVSLRPGGAWTVWAALGPPPHDGRPAPARQDDRPQSR
jgi:hypothetical protein